MIEFKLKGEYIELMQLLKVLRLVSTGGHAGMEISDGNVKVNGETDTRKRAKLRVGYTVEYAGNTIKIV